MCLALPKHLSRQSHASTQSSLRTLYRQYASLARILSAIESHRIDHRHSTSDRVESEAKLKYSEDPSPNSNTERARTVVLRRVHTARGQMRR